MNNSVTRVILGVFFTPLLFIISVYFDGSISANKLLEGFILTLWVVAIPSFVLSVFIEILNKKGCKHIYIYNALAGFVINTIYFSLVALTVNTSSISVNITIMDVFIMIFISGLVGIIQGAVITIPLRYLYKKQLKKKAKLEAENQ